MNRSLYEISADLSALEDALLESGGEADEQLEAWFDQIGEERNRKIVDYCKLIASLEAGAERCETEIARLAALRSAQENAARRLKERLKAFFEAHGLVKLQLGIFNPRIQSNGGKAPLIMPAKWAGDPASAPEAFQRRAVFVDAEVVRSVVTASSDGLVCPSCGEEIVVDAEEEKTPEPKVLACSCMWTGSREEAVQLGARGTHLRLR